MRGTDEQVGPRLAGGVGAVGGQGGRLGEGRVVGAERAVDLVGRDLDVPGRPRRPRGVEQALRAEDVGPQKGRGVVDRAIDVALGGEVDHRVEPLGQELHDQPAVGHVAVDEPVPRLVLEPFEVVGVAGVGQGVEVRELNVRIRLQFQTHEVRADEATAAGDEDSFHDPEPLPPLTYPLGGFRTRRGCLEETRDGSACLARRTLLHVH